MKYIAELYFVPDFQKNPKVDDDLKVCVLNLLPRVSTVPSLVAINLVKVEI